MKAILRYAIAGLFLILTPAVWALQDFEGQAHDFSTLLGQGDQWRVVMIWESGCPACNHVAHRYVDFHEFNAEQRAAVLGISIDGPARQADAQAFIERHQVQFPNLIATPQEAARLFRSLTGKPFLGTPSFLVFDPNGALRAFQAGPVPTDRLEQFILQAESAAAAR